ncbi:hypothetical protein [Microbacterium suaedae]|uniref:hypothetical protein n=1 Tax=Microbacterium suaedae TaxID=2067813 RepID=UPI000DA16F53|nr:hypothetical protein [Microbacterium suaedae]
MSFGPFKARSQGAAVFVAAAAILISTSGCAPSADGGNAGGAVTLPSKNVEGWTLPLDDFLLSDMQLKKSSYAGALLLSECLARQGIEIAVPFVDFDAAYGDQVHKRSMLTRGLAEEVGYRGPDSRTPAGIAAWEEYRTTQRSDVELKAMDACRTELGDEMPSYGNDVVNFTSSFAASAFQGAAASGEVTTAADAWRECVAAYGVEDLPDSPYMMPSESVRIRFGLNPAKDTPPAPLTQAEIDLALADVDCRESSGYHQALYDAIWEREARLLEENQAAFEEQRAAIEATDAEIDRIIAQYATAGGSS